MESIDSSERVSPVRLGTGEAPKHTQPEHRMCAYYPEMVPSCQHGEEAMGAFYSEDYVKDLRITGQLLVASIERLTSAVKKAGPALIKEVGEEALYSASDYLGPLSRTQIINLQQLADYMREITK